MHPYICFSIPSTIRQSMQINFLKRWLLDDYCHCMAIRDRHSARIYPSASTEWFARNKNLTNCYLKHYFYRRVKTLSPTHYNNFENMFTLISCMSFHGTAVSVSRTSLSIETILILRTLFVSRIAISILFHRLTFQFLRYRNINISVMIFHMKNNWMKINQEERICETKYPIFGVKNRLKNWFLSVIKCRLIIGIEIKRNHKVIDS